ncbi:MAG: helix-turn-helix transcriptional regulator [Pelomonas sp.]|nr:helix-turn-helix transcriptional regulator [Roseateles sp.]
MSTALELFWRQGFEGTSTAQLSAAMGIAPPSLYAAFGSKESLFREALALYGRRYGAFLTVPMGAQGSAREAIAQVLQGAARQFTDPRHPSGCMVAAGALQMTEAQTPLALEVASLRQAAQQAIRARLDRARRDSELPLDTDTATLAAFFAMTIQGMAVQARDGVKPTMLKRLADLAMQAWPQAVLPP